LEKCTIAFESGPQGLWIDRERGYSGVHRPERRLDLAFVYNGDHVRHRSNVDLVGANTSSFCVIKDERVFCSFLPCRPAWFGDAVLDAIYREHEGVFQGLRIGRGYHWRRIEALRRTGGRRAEGGRGPLARLGGARPPVTFI